MLLDGIAEISRCRDWLIDTDDLTRVGAPGHLRRYAGAIELDDGIKLGAVVALERLPVFDSRIPVGTLGGKRTALQVVEGCLIRRNHPRLGTHLDGHVADGHPLFHGQGGNGLTAELHHIAGATGGAGLADNGQDDVLGADALSHLPLDLDFHGLGTGLLQGLGRQHMFHFRGADAEGQGAEGAVGGGMGVAADDGGARQRQADLRAHDVHHTLPLVTEAIQRHTEVGTVLDQGLHLHARHLTGGGDVAALGRDVVIHCGPGAIRATHLASLFAQAIKGLRAGHFVSQVAVDVDDRGFAGGFIDHV